MPSSIVLNGTTGIANATWTNSTRPASPVAGQTGYNTDISAMETYTGSTWSTSDLPAPSTAGNVLTSNGTSWTSATLSVAGGATSTTGTTNITLTSSSNRIQYVNFTASSKSVTLPDATTLSAGGPVFVIANAGIYSFTVNLNSGLAIQSISPGQSFLFFLADNSTTDGKWFTEDSTFDISFGQTTTVTNSSVLPSGAFTGVKQSALIGGDTISSTSAVVTWHQGTNGQDIYGAVITLSGTTLSVGTPTLIYSGSLAAASVHYTRMYSSTNGMIVVARSTNLMAVPFTVSGSTITAGSGSATFGSATMAYYCGIQDLIAMSSTVGLICYFTTSGSGTNTVVFNTLTHNGTSAPTLGTASASQTSADRNTCFSLAKLTSTTAFCSAWLSSTGTLWGEVITISGTSAPTIGTPVNSGIDPATYYAYTNYAYPLSSTEVMCQGGTGALYWTISGTTPTYVGLTTLSSNTSSPYWAGTSSIGTIGISAQGGNGLQLFVSKYVSGVGTLSKGTVTLPVSLRSVNNGSSAMTIGLDSTYGIALTSNGGTTSVYAVLLKYIGV